jgi:hypothetical protein
MITSRKGARAVAEGVIGEDLGGAAEDGRVAIDSGIAGGHADVFRAEVAAEGEEFFIHQRLDGAGVNGAVALSEGAEVHGCGDEGFARAGGGAEDDVFVLEQFEDGFFLGGVEGEFFSAT